MDGLKNGFWHACSTEEALTRLKSDRLQGLSQAEALQRNESFGPNQLPSAPRRSVWRLFFRQFQNILIYVLLASGLIVSWLGDWLDASVIFAVTLINAFIGFIQEGKAESALEAIRKMLSLSANVLREGQKIQISADTLAPGDLVFLESGDRVPADLRLLEVKNLRIDEATLTGESVSVEKNNSAAPTEASIADRLCMAYSGTLVTYGQGLGVVVEIGSNTEMGQIGRLLSQLESQITPLQKQMDTFGRRLTGAISALSLAIFAFGVWVQALPVHEMFMAMVGLAVAAIPEGLPAVVTITLAVGVQRMAKRNAIIRKLSAVETLGEVSVICTDKTGTLTKNEMTVQAIATAQSIFQVKGVGYSALGSFESNGKRIDPDDHPELIELARAGVLCSDATLKEQEGLFQVQGDPTEGALLILALKAGLDLNPKEFKRLDIIPFESEQGFMATLYQDSQGQNTVFMKGAPETVIARCKLQSIDQDHWQARIQEFAKLGWRVLAIASRTTSDDTQKLTEAGKDFTLLGLCGLIDPPREEAIQAIQKCHEAGIRVKMITGDHALTAKAIGAQLKINSERVVTGTAIESYNDADLAGVALECDLFARTSPAHKLRLVQALQSGGQIVAMTGDGVNDAPALKRADVGVAMGLNGTEAAKEAAEIVLADDNFASIVHAVEEGRTIHDNLNKAIVYILPVSFGQAGAIMTAILFGHTLPITPLQILWVNMITAITLCLSLAVEPAEKGVMQRKPRDPNAPLLSWFFLWRIIFVSILLVAGLLGLFLWEMHQGGSIEKSRTVSINALVMGEVFYLFNSRFMHASALNVRVFFGNLHALAAVCMMLIFQAILTYMPFMQSLFGTQSIAAHDWGLILCFGALLFLTVETEKYLRRLSLIDFKQRLYRGIQTVTSLLFMITAWESIDSLLSDPFIPLKWAGGCMAVLIITDLSLVIAWMITKAVILKVVHERREKTRTDSKEIK